MWIDNKIFESDLIYINNASFIDWDKFQGKNFFITGGTGLIGYTLVCALLYRNLVNNSNINITLLVRNLDRARDLFKGISSECKKYLHFIEGDIASPINVDRNINYIVHAGGPTSSEFFAKHPVETITTITDGTRNILELAKKKSVLGMVFLSTMEVYGASTNNRKINERSESYLDVMVPRNSYPEAKRLGECLCTSYCEEYEVPVNVLRLTQTFGPGVKSDDNRVFAQFIRAVMDNRDIILLTEGKTKRNYLYTADAVTAILRLLQTDNFGKAYNAANEDTYCSIREMAGLVAKELGHDRINVQVSDGNINQVKKFMPTMNMDLDSSALRHLGWHAEVGLTDMFKRTWKTMTV